MLKIEDKELMEVLRACVEFVWSHVGGDNVAFSTKFAEALGVKTIDVNRVATQLVELKVVLDKAQAINPVINQRGIADVNRFLDKVRDHCNATGGDKYAQGRKLEPAQVIVDWFGEGWLAGDALKYISRMMRTGNEKDMFKAVHYLGMLYNHRFPGT